MELTNFHFSWHYRKMRSVQTSTLSQGARQKEAAFKALGPTKGSAHGKRVSTIS